jgi:hypothetical protein
MEFPNSNYNRQSPPPKQKSRFTKSGSSGEKKSGGSEEKEKKSTFTKTNSGGTNSGRITHFRIFSRIPSQIPQKEAISVTPQKPTPKKSGTFNENVYEEDLQSTIANRIEGVSK